MAVHAHPDDESSQTGGTLARYAAAGCRTVLITCTDGGQGDADAGAKPGQPGHDPHQVAALRSRELDRAASALGVTDLVKLGYPDSGTAESRESGGNGDAFSRRPMIPMVERLAGLMRSYRPDVVLTYPPNGLSGHPDHIRTHDVVVAAHSIVANGTVGPRLYYIALSRSRLLEVHASAVAAWGPDVWVPPVEMGVDDATITTIIDVESHWADKLRALAAHASQSDAATLLEMFTAAAAAEVVAGHRVEEYVRAYPAVVDAVDSIEDDFFRAVRPAN